MEDLAGAADSLDAAGRAAGFGVEAEEPFGDAERGRHFGLVGRDEDAGRCAGER